jgi:hypothetical protein
MRYRLRTLLILLAVGPILLAAGWWKYSAWRAEQARQNAIEAEKAQIQNRGLKQRSLQDLNAHDGRRGEG